MRTSSLPIYRLGLVLTLLLTGCGPGGAGDQASTATSMHQELRLVDPALYGSSQSAGLVSSQSLISIGSIYLEAQVAPLTVAGTTLQTSDISFKTNEAYVTFASVDTGGVIVKKGAVQHMSVVNCDNPLTLTHVEYCLTPGGSLAFADTDLFASYTDGTSLWAAGSTLDESVTGQYARLYKITLDASKNPAAIAVTRALASYAGTGIIKVGTNLVVTTGTSTNASMMGGLNLVDATTLAGGVAQPLYDARAVSADPVDATKVFAVRGAVSVSNPGAVDMFPADLSTTYTREIATGGNTIPESHSSVQAGKTLLLTSLGDQGLRVSCKATGASLATVPAPTVTGIASGKTVTNSVLAIPGYVLAANGEAGLYLYSFDKSLASNTSYCQGVTLTLLGRLSLASSGTYVNGELSANALTYAPYFNLLNLNVLVGKLVMVASGNKGVSLINLNALTVSTTSVDDF